MTKSGFAISEYHNTREIYEQIQQLVDQPIRPISRDAMDLYLKGFEKKYASSKAIIEEAKKVIPGGVQHNLAFNYPCIPDFFILTGTYTGD